MAKNILLADDDKDEFILLKNAVSKNYPDAEVRYAANWLDIWKILLKMLPDLLIMDLRIPVKDGLECLSSIRQHTKYDTMPIVMFSGSTNQQDIDTAYAQGANLYIIKPDSFQQLEKIVHYLFNMSQEQLLKRVDKNSFILNV